MYIDYKHIRFTFFQLVIHVKANKWWWYTSAAIYFCPSIFSFVFRTRQLRGELAASKTFPRTLYFSTAFNSEHKIRLFNFSWMIKQLFNIGFTIFTCLTRSMEEDFSHKWQLWKLFCWRNQIAARALKGVKCPLTATSIFPSSNVAMLTL